ncbi:MAG: hypothetical protein JNL18_02460 [Planctomycetaceae bacterium]|jgi:hypothetical protein|nr:hypothetical protein [Planctomycetaceae bacterium]
MKRMLFSLLAVAALCVASESAHAQWVVQPTTVWSPVVVPGPVVQPMVIQSGPVFAPAPVPVTTFYRAPIVTMQPVPRVVTRYRPILGGSVSRVRYGWAPVAF